MAKISAIGAYPILDSRGEWTIEVSLDLDNGIKTVAAVPQGKSCGSFEAAFVKPAKAVLNIKKIISPALRGINPIDQKKIDKKLISLDGTKNKSKLGANAILGTSVACVKSAAIIQKNPLWKQLRLLSGLGKTKKNIKPRLFINVVNGGLHAGNNLDFQEYLIIPRAKNFTDSIKIGIRIYQNLKDYLKNNFGPAATSVGDEGGFAPNFKNNLEPFLILEKIIEESEFKNKIDFGLDAAASNVKIKKEELFLIYEKMKKRFNLRYLEDPFEENNFEDFALIKEKFGRDTLIAGDDLTVTNIERMKKAKDKESINSIIIKPNQIGTVTETIEAIKAAKKWNWAVVISHRSGETNDDFVADLAFAVDAYGLKLGSPARGERIAKYDRLLELDRVRR